MPTYELRGVSVEFPHEAYDCQVCRSRAAQNCKFWISAAAAPLLTLLCLAAQVHGVRH